MNNPGSGAPNISLQKTQEEKLRDFIMSTASNFEESKRVRAEREDSVMQQNARLMLEGKETEAIKVLMEYFNNEINEVKILIASLSAQEKPKNQKSDIISLLAMMKSEENSLEERKKDLGVTRSDYNKSKLENSSENINLKLRTKIKEISKLNVKIEEKTKTKLSDSEKMDFQIEISEIKNDFETWHSKLSQEEQEKIKNSTKKIFDDIYEKAKQKLEKKFDESPDKIKKIEEGLNSVGTVFSAINADVISKIDKDKKLKDEDKVSFDLDISNQEKILIDLAESVNGVSEELNKNPENITEKQRRGLNLLLIKIGYVNNSRDKLRKKLDEEKNMSAKDQRDNAKAMSDRMVVTEKQISEAHDKLPISEKFPAGEKEGFQVLLDIEDVNLKEIKSELEKLEAKNDDADNPTKILVKKIVNRIEKRLLVLHEKLEQERKPKEKDVLEKLDAAEKEIEKTESKIRDISQKMAEEKNKIKQEVTSGDKNISAIASIGKIVMGPTNPMTYHDQYDVSSEMAHALDDINTAKDWINMMPADDEKQRKLKNKLRSKSRRMYRRQSSVKWRHFMKLPAGQMGKYVGNKMISDPIMASYDKMADRVFGGR
jgi:hypothetical protein